MTAPTPQKIPLPVYTRTTMRGVGTADRNAGEISPVHQLSGAHPHTPHARDTDRGAGVGQGQGDGGGGRGGGRQSRARRCAHSPTSRERGGGGGGERPLLLPPLPPPTTTTSSPIGQFGATASATGAAPSGRTPIKVSWPCNHRDRDTEVSVPLHTPWGDAVTATLGLLSKENPERGWGGGGGEARGEGQGGI